LPLTEVEDVLVLHEAFAGYSPGSANRPGASPPGCPGKLRGSVATEGCVQIIFLKKVIRCTPQIAGHARRRNVSSHVPRSRAAIQNLNIGQEPDTLSTQAVDLEI